MSFGFFADEIAYREQTDRQSQMAGVTGPSFRCGVSSGARAAQDKQGGSMRKEIIGAATLTTAIYALVEWGSEMPRYVGKTVQYLHERHKAHIRDAKRGGRRPVHYWLRKRIAEGRVAIKLLEYVPAGADWAARERYWINRFRAEGHDILNLTDGGEGLAGYVPTEQHRARIAAALRTGSECDCLRCGTTFWRKANEIARGHNKFCSRACANSTNKGGKRAA